MTEALAALGGFPGIAAILTGLGSLIASLKALRNTQELKPNHGSSFRDLVARNTVKLEQTNDKLDLIEQRLEQIEKRDEEEFKKLWTTLGILS